MLRYAEAIAYIIYIQSLLLSLWQLFCRHITKANWKFWICMTSFIANVLSTWILKTVAVPKQGELPYYRLQITYSDWVFSVRTKSIWRFKNVISSRWDRLIIMGIIAKYEPTFKHWSKKDAGWFIDKKYIFYKYFIFEFWIWITDLRVSTLKSYKSLRFLLYDNPLYKHVKGYLLRIPY